MSSEQSPQTVDFSQRNPDCIAKVYDDGQRRSVPVCMGGMALVGCTRVHFQECIDLRNQRAGIAADDRPGYAFCLLTDGTDNTVRAITVPKEYTDKGPIDYTKTEAILMGEDWYNREESPEGEQ